MNELQVREIKMVPAVVEFNKTELLEVAKNIAEEYNGLVFTDETVKEGKKTVAELRKIQKSVNQFKVDKKKELTASVTQFENDCKEIMSAFDGPINFIDNQLKDFEENRVKVRTALIQGYIKDGYENCEIEQKFRTIEIKSDWLNATAKDKDILSGISYELKACQDAQKKYKQDVELIGTLVELANAKYQLNVHIQPVTFVSMLEYKTIDSIKELITEQAESQQAQEQAYKERIEREAEEKAQAQIEEVKEVARQQIDEMAELVVEKMQDNTKVYDKSAPTKVVGYKIRLNAEQYKDLNQWLSDNGIEFKVV